MKMAEIPFGITDWDDVPSTEHAGETGTATADRERIARLAITNSMLSSQSRATRCSLPAPVRRRVSASRSVAWNSSL